MSQESPPPDNCQSHSHNENLKTKTAAKGLLITGAKSATIKRLHPELPSQQSNWPQARQARRVIHLEGSQPQRRHENCPAATPGYKNLLGKRTAREHWKATAYRYELCVSARRTSEISDRSRQVLWAKALGIENPRSRAPPEHCPRALSHGLLSRCARSGPDAAFFATITELFIRISRQRASGSGQARSAVENASSWLPPLHSGDKTSAWSP